MQSECSPRAQLHLQRLMSGMTPPSRATTSARTSNVTSWISVQNPLDQSKRKSYEDYCGEERDSLCAEESHARRALELDSMTLFPLAAAHNALLLRHAKWLGKVDHALDLVVAASSADLPQPSACVANHSIGETSVVDHIERVVAVIAELQEARLAAELQVSSTIAQYDRMCHSHSEEKDHFVEQLTRSEVRYEKILNDYSQQQDALRGAEDEAAFWQDEASRKVVAANVLRDAIAFVNGIAGGSLDQDSNRSDSTADGDLDALPELGALLDDGASPHISLFQYLHITSRDILRRQEESDRRKLWETYASVVWGSLMEVSESHTFAVQTVDDLYRLVEAHTKNKSLTDEHVERLEKELAELKEKYRNECELREAEAVALWELVTQLQEQSETRGVAAVARDSETQYDLHDCSLVSSDGERIASFRWGRTANEVPGAVHLFASCFQCTKVASSIHTIHSASRSPLSSTPATANSSMFVIIDLLHRTVRLQPTSRRGATPRVYDAHELLSVSRSLDDSSTIEVLLKNSSATLQLQNPFERERCYELLLSLQGHCFSANLQPRSGFQLGGILGAAVIETSIALPSSETLLTHHVVFSGADGSGKFLPLCEQTCGGGCVDVFPPEVRNPAGRSVTFKTSSDHDQVLSMCFLSGALTSCAEEQQLPESFLQLGKSSAHVDLIAVEVKFPASVHPTTAQQQPGENSPQQATNRFTSVLRHIKYKLMGMLPQTEFLPVLESPCDGSVFFVIARSELIGSIRLLNIVTCGGTARPTATAGGEPPATVVSFVVHETSVAIMFATARSSVESRPPSDFAAIAAHGVRSSPESADILAACNFLFVVKHVAEASMWIEQYCTPTHRFEPLSIDASLSVFVRSISSRCQVVPPPAFGPDRGLPHLIRFTACRPHLCVFDMSWPSHPSTDVLVPLDAANFCVKEATLLLFDMASIALMQPVLATTFPKARWSVTLDRTEIPIQITSAAFVHPLDVTLVRDPQGSLTFHFKGDASVRLVTGCAHCIESRLVHVVEKKERLGGVVGSAVLVAAAASTVVETSWIVRGVVVGSLTLVLDR